MTELRTCRACGAQIDKSAPFGHCPRCLIEHGFLGPDESLFEAGRPNGVQRVFGDYELLQQIGRGAMGLVFKARQISLDRIVALKMVRDSELDSPTVIRRFQEEAETVARMDHPNILPIYEVGEHEDHLFFSMKLVEGDSLEEWLARSKLQIPGGENANKAAVRGAQVRIATLLITIARAVHYAHQKGILHRDLKPSNILLDAHEQPFVTDFGVSKRMDRNLTITEDGAVLGTPAYMAPEQAAGKQVTIAADVYSLGAILYHLLTGCCPPFQAATPMATLRLVMEQEPRKPRLINEAVDPDLETICLKCLEKDPKLRYGSAQALAEDLDRWRRQETILARPAGPLLRTNRWIRRNPVGTLLIMSLSLGLLASLSLTKVALDQKRSADQAKQSAEQERLNADRAREIIWEKIGVSDFWEKPDATVTISSEILALITGEDRIVPAGFTTERYQVGMLLEEMPVDTIIGYAYLLSYLEKELSDPELKILSRQGPGISVRLDLKLYQENRTAIEDIAKGEVDFLKIGGQSFLRASMRDSRIVPLVAQNPIKTGVIFARKDSGITNLIDLAGKSVAVGGSNSTVRLWATFHLLQSGVSATNLDAVGGGPADPGLKKAGRLQRAPKLKSGQRISDHAPVVEAVLTNRCVAGAASEKALQRYPSANTDFVVLKQFASSPVFWLAGGTIPPRTAKHFTDAMVGLHDPVMFERLSDKVTHYSPVTPEQLAELRQAAQFVTEQSGGEHEDSE